MTSIRDRIMYGHLVSLRNEPLMVGLFLHLLGAALLAWSYGGRPFSFLCAVHWPRATREVLMAWPGALLRSFAGNDTRDMVFTRNWHYTMLTFYGLILGHVARESWTVILISWLFAVSFPLLLFFVSQHPVVLLIFAYRFFGVIRNWHHSRRNRLLLSRLVDVAKESITSVVRHAGLAQQLDKHHNDLLLVRNDRLSKIPFDSSSHFGQQYQLVTKSAALAFLPFARLPEPILIRFHEYLANTDQFATLIGAVPVVHRPLLDAMQPRLLRHPIPIKPASRRARMAMALRSFLPTRVLLDAYLHLLQDFVTLTLTTFAALLSSASPPDPVDFRRISDRFFGFTFTILSPDPSATISIQPVLDHPAFEAFALWHNAWQHAISAVPPPHEWRLQCNFFAIEVELAARQNEAEKAQQELTDAVVEAILRWKEVKLERERAAVKAQRQGKDKGE
ncbi:hypothetical protein JCM10213_006021 [Rhodosporidiobolus nylandii]